MIISTLPALTHLHHQHEVAEMLMLAVSIAALLATAMAGQTTARTGFPIVPGLSWTYYLNTCPSLERLVQQKIETALADDVTLAAGILRLSFHDCFVQGCDASILLKGSSEEEALPNLTLRPEALELINEIKAFVDETCSQVVSCADILALAARDSVYQVGGPYYPVPLGRRDSLTSASTATTLANLPSPFSTLPTILALFASKGFGLTDLVALAGAHTIGIAHCFSFQNRLYPTEDITLLPSFASLLYATCPSVNSTNWTYLDLLTPTKFDNKYYVDLLNYEGLLTSDEELYINDTSRSIVEEFATKENHFFRKFAYGMVKMIQLDVLTGTSGEIRENCSVANPSDYLVSRLDI